MQRSIRFLLLIFMILWLPAQGFAMALSSGCDDTHQTRGVDASHHHSRSGIKANTKTSHSDSPLCADCDFCHQCGAAALPSVPVIGHGIRPGFQRSLLTVDFSSHIPDSPHKPPLAMPS